MKVNNLYGKQNNWFVADFETLTHNTDYFDENQDTRVILAYLKNLENTKEYLTTNLNDFMNYLINLNSSSTIFFHNLTFDGWFIIPWLIQNGFKSYSEKNKRGSWFVIFFNAGKIYYIKVKVRKPNKEFYILFRCSLRMLNSSVEVLGKSVNLNKFNDDDTKTYIDNNGRERGFYDVEPNDNLKWWMDHKPRFVEYLKNDVEIVRLSLNEFRTSVNNTGFIQHRDNKVKKYNAIRTDKTKNYKLFEPLDFLTSARLTSELMKKSVIQYIDKNNLRGFFPLDMNPKEHEFIQSWFVGGYTQFNDKFSGNAKKCAPAMMIDVSSAYPYQMTFSLPYGKILTEKPSGIENRNYYTFLDIQVKSAVIKKEYYNAPILLNWKKRAKEINANTRYERELKDFRCFYTSFEWEMILKYYDVEIKSISYFYMKAKPFLNQYANELYDLKNHYSKIKKDGLKQGIKILINAGYGCLAKRLKYDTNIFVDKEDAEFFLKMERDDYFFIDENEYKFKFCKSFTLDEELFRISCESTYDKQKAPNKAAAVIITARQRVYLWKMIELIGCKYFGYSDTDSILFVNLSEEKLNLLNSIIKNNNVELGDWEQELKNYNITYFGTYGAKKYQLLDENKNLIKFRFAGVSEKMVNPKYLVQEINFDEGVIKIQHAVLIKQFCKNGIILVPQDKEIKKGNI